GLRPRARGAHEDQLLGPRQRRVVDRRRHLPQPVVRARVRGRRARGEAMRARGLALAALAALAAGCAPHAAVPDVRFANAAAVAVVDDRRDVPERPKRRTNMPDLYHLDGHLSLVTRPLALPEPRRALGVNALDEVPDST